MEEGSDKTRLIIGIVAVVVIVIIAFFLLRGLFSRKTITGENASTPTPTATVGFPTTQPTGVPTNVPARQNTTKGGLPVGGVGTTTYRSNTTGSNTNSTVYWYYSSQSSSQGNESQNQDGNSQSQSQTLPGGFTQSQNQ